MATNSKKYSRTRGIKGLLALIVLAAAAAIGAVTGYLPASNYINTYNLADLAVHGDWLESTAYANMLSGALNAVDSFQGGFREAAEVYEDFGVYLRLESGSVVIKNEVKPAVVFRADSQGVSLSSGDSRYFPRIMRSYFQYREGLTVYFGFTESMLSYEQQQWDISHRNVMIILFTDLALLVTALAAGIALCRVIGENADGEPVFSRFYGLWYEVSAALVVTVICLAAAGYSMSRNTSQYMDLGFQPTFERIWYMVWWGLAAMGIAGVILYFLLSISVRVKNRKTAEGSLVFIVLRGLWRAIKAVCGFLKSLFTGELFSTDRAAKKLAMVDCVFLGTSVVLAIAVFVCNGTWNYGWMTFYIVLGVILLGLFVFGRVRMITDEAQLEQQIRELSRGNYSYTPKLSRNSAYAKSSEILSTISGKYRQGIEESVKAERMKIELVTNVSHDLKTPLTSIISYVDLLSKEQLPPQAAEYVGVLQKKSERLKNIVADVFELAKTTSGEITVEHERLDLTRLSNQTLAEMEDKITAAGFIVKANICEPPVEVISDGKRLYRVIQNLLDNALKYSMKGTRIYYTLEKNGDRAVITIKNIAAYEMDFTKEEILERFTRGDKARSTEGSGLGLSIAQGFTIACGGEFDIDIDGDMFKVMIAFRTAPVAGEEVAAPAESAENTAVEAKAAADSLGRAVAGFIGRLSKKPEAAAATTTAESPSDGAEAAPEAPAEPQKPTVTADE